ncbi:uncharacterized protein LOC142885488 [Nelusetta ayraudi]|uniref:uncharacterized protein LOC142885488 n=1 Tax=Nelusetta ayraudi TaxID=303726 RepID=UPI003F717895
MWQPAALLLLVVAVLEHIKHGCCSGSSVFVQTGRDLTLDVNESISLKSGDDFLWKCNNRNILKYNGQQTRFYETVKFSEHNFSLHLNNVNARASGTYTAVVSGPSDIIVDEYQVTVLDPVTPVNLTVKSTSSSDSCNYIVTCTTQTATTNSTVKCNNGICSLEGGEARAVTASGASLHVYLEQDSIICNHSNQVSWTKDKRTIEDLCVIHSGNATNVAIIATSTIGITIVVLILLGVSIYFRRRRTYNTQSAENTTYDVVGESQPAPDPRATNDPSPSEYCMVGPHSDLAASTERQHIPQAESLYAMVQKSAQP